MKREGNLFDKIWNKQNIYNAYLSSKKNKGKRFDVKRFEENLCENINKISDMIKNKKYKVSKYKVEKRKESGKDRIIYILPYNPDQIIQHAVMQVVQPILEKTYIKDTYQSIKGRGIHSAKKRIEKQLKDKENCKYCFKIDIEKFYPSIDNNILKQLLRRKIKCKDTLELLDVLIDSTKRGIPIGNYSSPTFGNFCLTYFDHYVKEELKVKNYIRYADDMIFLADKKEKLHEVKNKVIVYLKTKLKLKLKSNFQIFPTFMRGIDYLGFRFFNHFTLLRKRIKKKIKKLVNKKPNIHTVRALSSYWGWLKHTNSYNLLRKILTKEVLEKYKRFCAKAKIKNLFRKIIIVPKKEINKFGNFQPNLLNFI